MLAKKVNNTIQVSFNYNHALVQFVKSFSGRKYDPAKKVWTLPLVNGLKTIERLSGRGFAIETDLLAVADQEEKRVKEVLEVSKLDDTEFETSLPLFPYQRVGSAFLCKVGSGLLGDEMGLGKTIQALAVCENTKAEKILIFCPSAVKWQWADEIKKFLNEYRVTVVVVDGKKTLRRTQWAMASVNIAPTYVIANYELLLHDFDLINMVGEWDVLIADEATRISNPMAKQSKAIKKLQAKRRIALTGTPISNRANEIWNIVDFLNTGALGSYWDFVQHYCLKNQFGGIYGYQNMGELGEILKRYMIRRHKADVLPELPDKISTDIPFELSAEEKALYKKIKKEILFEIEAKDIKKLESPMTIQYTLVKMLRLRQLADSMELLGENVQSSKLEVLKELLTEALKDNTKKAIVFTQFAEMADILERELKEWKPFKISGKIKEEYHTVVERFNEDESNRVLIMTAAGMFGLNIQKASIIFHYDQEWSLGKMQQRAGRAHRIGQKDTVLEYNLLAKGTVDYYVKKVLHDKAKLSDELLGDKPIDMDEIRDILNYE